MKENFENILEILREELVPAMGCTEPIAVAYAAAIAGETLGTIPERAEIAVSGNILKNVKSVIVPNSGGQRGIETAAVLGCVGGDAERAFEVLQGVTEDDIARTRELAATGMCETRYVEGKDNLYIRIEMTAGAEGAGRVSGAHHCASERQYHQECQERHRAQCGRPARH